MKKELKEKWINALRSGKYTQTFRYLKYGNCFCVIGVLCDVAEMKPTDRCGKAFAYGGSFYRPNQETLDNLKINKGFVFKLMNLNDEKHYNFNKLADIIEKELIIEDENND